MTISSITLADGQETPVNHVFIPLGQDKNNVWWFEDQKAGLPEIGYNRISLQLIRPVNSAPGVSSNDRLSRVKIGLHCPVLNTLGTNDAGITPAASVAYVDRWSCEFVLSARDTAQNREDVLLFAQGLLTEVQVENMVLALQNLYG